MTFPESEKQRQWRLDMLDRDYPGWREEADTPESRVSAYLRLADTDMSNREVAEDIIRTREKMRRKTGNPARSDVSKPPPWHNLGQRLKTGNIIESGRFLEVWLSMESLHVGGSEGGQKADSPGRKKEDNESIARRTNSRARKQIRRIVNTNDLQAMHTLTLAPKSAENDKKYQTTSYVEQKDYDLVRKIFKQFVQRLLRNLGTRSIPYLVVLELHDSAKTSPEKRGTWHLHLCTSTDNKIKAAVRKSWWHGRTDYQDYRYDKQGKRRETDICNPGAYVAEYIGKEGAQFGQNELRGKRRYTVGEATLRPVKRDVDGAGISGDFERIEYNGKTYRNIYYNCLTVPGTALSSHTAHYVEERRP